MLLDTQHDHLLTSAWAALVSERPLKYCAKVTPPDFEATLVDYEFLNGLGLVNGVGHNCAALAVQRVREDPFDFALECSDAAISDMPQDIVLHSNRSILLARGACWEEAFAGFKQAKHLAGSEPGVPTFHKLVTSLKCVITGVRDDATAALAACYEDGARSRIPPGWLTELDEVIDELVGLVMAC